MNLTFDYTKEPSRDVLCIDVKSFYASVECVERGLDPLKTMLVVMSNSENSGGLVLAASRGTWNIETKMHGRIKI
ncbi:hypothetical protein UCM_03108 [Enterococcus faecalis EnGen0243]|nr:hypothetical protein UCM_03108 [Enterococcus faecalis EnGen0243]EOJ90235.1 hypothetical protein WOE_00593 [Enterococcus faecalis EnGen0358]EOL46554.1 hypothetical protein UCC_02688 [Enterococcus faecalis EnGen0238]